MVEIAKELIETMHAGQEFVAVTEMVLAKLGSSISQRLADFRDGSGLWPTLQHPRQARRPWSVQRGLAIVQ
jgi:hypothetical protein